MPSVGVDFCIPGELGCAAIIDIAEGSPFSFFPFFLRDLRKRNPQIMRAMRTTPPTTTPAIIGVLLECSAVILG